VQLIFFTNVALDDGAVALMEICEYLQELFIGLVDASDEVG